MEGRRGLQALFVVTVWMGHHAHAGVPDLRRVWRSDAAVP